MDWTVFSIIAVAFFAAQIASRKLFIEAAKKQIIEHFTDMIENNEEITMVIRRDVKK